MIDPPKKSRFRLSRFPRLLEFDSWLDSTLYESSFQASEDWERVIRFFRKFRATGWKKAFVELGSEGVTIGLVGLFFFYWLSLLAVPATETNWLRQDDVAVTFLDRYGNEIGTRGIYQRDSVPVSEMPDHLIQAVLATEDRRFFDHWGIDPLGLARAMVQNAQAGGVVQGGSTLTQQLAKNLFLTNERTFLRKVKEAYLSLWLEMHLSKTEIIQLYLDRAYMGGGTFGISAAAEFYFDKDVRDLNLAESAMLAGLFKAPARYAPHVNLPNARARANEVLTNLVQAGFMTEGQVAVARNNPATPVDRDQIDSPDYYLDWAFEQVEQIIVGLPSRTFVARTAFDPGLQRAAEESCQYHLRQFGENYDVSECAIVLMEADGAVRALVGGQDYGKSQFNRATHAQRQAGSSFKPYVYAAAMEQGLTPDSIVPDVPINWTGWSPQNYNRSFAGRVNLTTALVKSINTVPAHLARNHIKGGTTTIANLAYDMGVESPITEHKTMVLGTSDLTVMDQATGYSVFASGGWAGQRYTITELTSYSGEVMWSLRDREPPHRALSDEAVSKMNQMLVQIPEWGTARRASLAPIPTAGKTGTTQSYRDAWFVGFTGNYVAAVWMGNDNNSVTNRLTGGNLPAMVWKRLMEVAHRNIELKPIPGIDRELPKPEALAEANQAEDGEEVSSIAVVSGLPQATTERLRSIADMFGVAAPTTERVTENDELRAALD